MDRLGLLNQGIPWFIQISAYVFFSIIVVLLMQMISIVYHTSEITSTEKSICFPLQMLLFLLVVIFSSFRYIRIDSYQFKGYNNYFNIGGIDTLSYLGFYESADNYSLKEYINEIPMEKFYAIIFWVFYHLHLDYKSVLCLNYLIVYAALIKYCKVFDLRSKYFLPLISLLIIVIQSYNTLRWSTSLLLSIWVIAAILNNKLLRAFVLTLIFSLCFHTGSLSLLVPVFGFIFSKNLRKPNRIFLFFISVLFVCLFIYAFPLEKILGDNRLVAHLTSGGGMPLAWSLLYLFYLFNVFYIRKKYFESEFRKKMFFICFFLMPLCLPEIKMMMMYRFSHFGHIVTYFGLVELLKVNKKINVGIIFNGIIYLLLLLNILTFYGNDIISCGVPYIFGTLL